MGVVKKIAEATYKGRYPSIMKEIALGLTVGLGAGLLWKMHQWNEQRRIKQFYDLLDKGQVTVVVTDHEPE